MEGGPQPPTLELVQNAARLEDIATGPPTKDDGATCSAATTAIASDASLHDNSSPLHDNSNSSSSEDEDESCSDGKDWGAPPPPGKLVRQVTPPNGLVIPPIAVNVAADYAEELLVREEEEAEAEEDEDELHAVSMAEEEGKETQLDGPLMNLFDAVNRDATLEVSELVSDGIDVDVADVDGRTALMSPAS